MILPVYRSITFVFSDNACLTTVYEVINLFCLYELVAIFVRPTFDHLIQLNLIAQAFDSQHPVYI